MSDLQQLNRQMTERVLASPAVPFQEGAYALRVASIRGRKSHQIHSLPLAVFMHQGQLFLVSPKRERPWALNLLESRRLELQAEDESGIYTAELAPAEPAVAVLRAYYNQLTWQRQQFPFDEETPSDEIHSKLDWMAVFLLQPEAD